MLLLVLIWLLLLRTTMLEAPQRQLLCAGEMRFTEDEIRVLVQVAGCQEPLSCPGSPPIGYLLSGRVLRSAHIFLGSVPWWSSFLAPRRVWVIWDSQTPASIHRARRILCRNQEELGQARECLRQKGLPLSRCSNVGFSDFLEREPDFTGAAKETVERHKEFLHRFPIARPELFFFTASDAKTGGQLYNQQMIQELREKHVVVHQCDLGSTRRVLGLQGWLAVPFVVVMGFILGFRDRVFIVDQAYSHLLVLALWFRKLLGRGKLITVVHHLNAYDSKASGRWSRWYRVPQIRPSDLVVTVSQYCKEEIQSLGYGVDKIAIISGGIHPGSLPDVQARRQPTGPLRLLFVGQCTKRKGLNSMMQALAQCEAENFELHLVGDQSTGHFKSEIQPLIQELGLAERIHCHGRVSSERLEQFYAETDALVFPSSQEGFGLVVLEAMFSGLPVLCSRATALPELVEDGVNGYLFEPGNPADIARVLNKAQSDPERLLEMGEAGRQKAQEYSTWAESRSRFYQAVKPYL